LTCERVFTLLLLLLSAGGFIYATQTIPIRGTFAQQLGNDATTDIIKQPVERAESSICTPAQIGEGSLERNTTPIIRTTIVNGSANATTDNATSIIGEEDNLSTIEIRDYIKEACIALQIGDSEGALFFLNLALGEL
jgi:hypothetical protein